MRYFSKIEREVIDYICAAEPASDACSIKNLFERKCDCSMFWHRDILTIYVKDDSAAKEMVSKLLNIICLLDYLKSEGLIYLFGNINKMDSFINRVHGHKSFEEDYDLPIMDDGDVIPAIDVKINKTYARVALNPVNLSKDASKKIFDFINCSFFCSETLHHIKDQDYKDDATIQYEDNRCLTWVAIAISFAVGLIATIYNHKMYNQNEKHHLESLSQSQKKCIVHDSINQLYDSIELKENQFLLEASTDSFKLIVPILK